MIFPFNQYEFVYSFKDIERCPYMWTHPNYSKWIEEDDKRKLLIALERYAKALKCEHKIIRVVTNYGIFLRCDKCERYEHLK